MNKKIAVIGGGTGSYTVLSGLKKHQNLDITAIVASTDSGGSTGRLRDEFGHLPVGDIRQCVVALAENEEEQNILRDLFSYRFNKGEAGLKGHNLGNLFMTAARDILGDELQAIEAVEKIFNIRGKVYPSTLEQANLIAKYENGSVLKGEHEIDEPAFPHDGRLRIQKLYTEPEAWTYQEVSDALKDADLIILSPGDLYTSLIANLIVKGIPEAIRETKGKTVYISNLVTKFGHTYNFGLGDHVAEVEKYLETKLDYILDNNAMLPDDILLKYVKENAFPVKNDMHGDDRVIEMDLLANEEIQTAEGDILKRSLIRHDGDKIASAIQNLLN